MPKSQQPRAFFPDAVTNSDKLFPAPGKECPEKKAPGDGENGGKLREFRWERAAIRRVRRSDEYVLTSAY